jgi:hypothetical protein
LSLVCWLPLRAARPWATNSEARKTCSISQVDARPDWINTRGRHRIADLEITGLETVSAPNGNDVLDEPWKDGSCDMKTTSRFLHGGALVLASAALAACGGGGGSSPAAPPVQAARVTLSAGNYEAAANEGTAAAMDMTSIATTNNVLIGVGSSAKPNWTAFGLQQVARLPELFRAGTNHLAGVSSTQTLACINGGTISATAVDNNGNGSLDAGDKATLVFTNCIESPATLNGTITLTVNTISGTPGSYPIALDVTMTFQGLRIVTPSLTAGADGNIRVASSRTGFQLGSDSITSTTFSESATVGATTYSRSIANFSAAVTYGATFTSSTIQGVIGSSALGNATIAISTPQPFLKFYTDAYPYTGVFVVTGANNGTATVTALNNTQVSIALDANGDGTPEVTVIKLWSAIQ